MARICLNKTTGYTFIELTVVVSMIGVLLTLAAPVFRHTELGDQLKAATREMVSLIKELRSKSILEQKTFILNFDLQSNRFWICSSDMSANERKQRQEKAFLLPEGIKIISLSFKGEDAFSSSDTGITFTKKGYIRPAIISFGSEDGRAFTLELSPFLGRIKVLERHTLHEYT